MTEARIRSILRKARRLVQNKFIRWALTDYKGGYCAEGALLEAVHHNPESFRMGQLLLDEAARSLHPKLKGKVKPRRGRMNALRDDVFDRSPTVYVNNQLGKEAILKVFDRAIASAAEDKTHG